MSHRLFTLISCDNSEDATANTPDLIAYGSDGLMCVNDYATDITQAPLPLPPGSITPQGLCGDGRNGTAMFSGNTVWYRAGQEPSAKWSPLADPTFTIRGGTIQGITGGDANGVAVFSGRQVLYMENYAENEWKERTAVPSNIRYIRGIVGDNANGVAIYSDTRVARYDMNSDEWVELESAKVPIICMTGDTVRGMVMYGIQGGKSCLWQMSPATGNSWMEIPSHGSPIHAMAGNPRAGVICSVGDGDTIAYCGNVDKGKWSVVTAS